MWIKPIQSGFKLISHAVVCGAHRCQLWSILGYLLLYCGICESTIKRIILLSDGKFHDSSHRWWRIIWVLIRKLRWNWNRSRPHTQISLKWHFFFGYGMRQFSFYSNWFVSQSTTRCKEYVANSQMANILGNTSTKTAVKCTALRSARNGLWASYWVRRQKNKRLHM